VFTWSLRPLLDAGCDKVIVVVPDGWLERAREMTRGVDKLTFTVGGDSRQESVANGLELVTSGRVVVQDAARPFVTADLVARALAELRNAQAAIAAIPVSDTLKRAAGESGGSLIVQQSLDRTSLWRSQTPGAFVTDALRDAHNKADEEGFVGTDESQLIERCGGRVALVEGSVENIKLTYPEDFALAEAIVKARS
jgi:2-C-methyl-D-erythritol 4-phosphate cytidylyltransferase